MSGRVVYSVVSTDPDNCQCDDRQLTAAFPVQSPATTPKGSLIADEMSHPMRKWKIFPGRNRFCCDGWLMTSKQSGVFYFTCALIVITTGLFLGFDCPYLALNLTPAVPAVAILIFVFVMSTLLRTAFSDPGIIPRATPQEAAETERRIDAPTTSGVLQLPPRIKEVEINGITVKLKYCFTCKIFRPPRASHCGICDNCVERFDHHCPWVGNCIGKRNYRYFYLFLVSLSVDCVFILGFSITTLVLRSMNSDFLRAIKDSPASLVEAIVAFLSVWSVFGLAGFHTYLSVCNITTNEDIKSANSKSSNVTSLYSHDGLCANFVEVICGPMPPSLIDRRGFVMGPESDVCQTTKIEQLAVDDDTLNTQDELLNNITNTSTAPILAN